MWSATVKELRKIFVRANFGFPKMEIGTAIGTYREDSTIFEREARPSIEMADFISVNAKWQNEDDMVSRIWYVRNLVLMYSKPVYVTFTNHNNNTPKSDKAEQYLLFYNEMSITPLVKAAFCHTLSSSNPEDAWAVWRTEQKESAIPSIIGGRDF